MTVADNKKIKVQNLVNYQVGYRIPEMNIRRIFSGSEVKDIAAKELRALFYQKGGQELLVNYLSVKDAELAKEFGVGEDVIEHEYNWTQDDVDHVLTSGTNEVLLDALDFAPEGIKDMIVNRAIDLRIPDMNKRDIIEEKTGHNVDAMIKMQIELEHQIGENNRKEEKPKTRRAGASTTPQRRAKAE